MQRPTAALMSAHPEVIAYIEWLEETYMKDYYAAFIESCAGSLQNLNTDVPETGG